MAFDLKNYETVKARKQRFYETTKDGRIVVNAEKITDAEAIFFVQIFKCAEDQKNNLPWSTGYAQEFKAQGSPANRTSWCENCEESAVGRALDNAGYASKMGPSREEMEKVSRATAPKEAAADHPAAYNTATKLSFPPDEMDNPEEFQISFGEHIGKRLKSFNREQLLEFQKKVSTYLSGKPGAEQKYFDVAEAIGRVLAARLPF